MSKKRDAYTKFGINYVDNKKEIIFNYVAFHDKTKAILVVKENHSWLNQEFPYEITTSTGSCFNIHEDHRFTEITAKEFWTKYEEVATKILLIGIGDD